MKKQRNRDERIRVAQGKKPFFLKKGDVRALKVLEQYEGASGVQQKLKVRRKRAAGKMGRRLPK